MGRAPCCDKANVKKGPWSPEEDATLKEYIDKNGTGGNWIALPQKVGIRRCGKSCRLRWLNYLRPNIKHGEFSEDEDRIICTLFASIGSRWSIIAGQLPGRTDNDIKNYWNTKLKKKLLAMAAPSKNSFLQTSSSMASPLYSSFHSQIPSLYQPGNSNSYTTTTPVMAFSRSSVYDQPIISSTSDAFQDHYNQLNKDSKSCSSSDGSCITNQISHAKDHQGDQNYCFQSYFSEENQKFLFSTNDGYSYSSSSAAAAAAAENIGYNPVDHSLEEINQLISTDNNNICNDLNFFVDEIKTEDQVLDY